MAAGSSSSTSTLGSNGSNRVCPCSKESSLEDLFFLEELFPKVSRTFDFTLKSGMKDTTLFDCDIVQKDVLDGRFSENQEESRKCWEEFGRSYKKAWHDDSGEMEDILQPYLSPMLKYMGYRVVDTIDDIPSGTIANEDKRYFMRRAIEALVRSKHDTATSIQTFFSSGEVVSHEGYRTLMKNFSRLVKSFTLLRPELRDSFNRWALEMVDGFSDPSVNKDIRTFDDHIRYCHYAAGVVGFDMTEDLVNLGFVNKDIGLKLMPDPENMELGVNPAHDFGVGLQLINDLKDYYDDCSAGIRRWPSDLFKVQGIGYDDLAHFPVSDGNRAKGRIILEEQLAHAKPYLLASNTWIENLPKRPVGFRIAWGDALAFSAATWRVIAEGKDNYFTPEGKRKIDRKDIGCIHKTMVDLAYDKREISPFIVHLMEKPAEEYLANSQV